jgi:hypothetical protein
VRKLGAIDEGDVAVPYLLGDYRTSARSHAQPYAELKMGISRDSQLLKTAPSGNGEHAFACRGSRAYISRRRTNQD